MPAKESSKNNPLARKVEGWRCSQCGTVNPKDVRACSGTLTTLTLYPVGGGMRRRFVRSDCTVTR